MERGPSAFYNKLPFNPMNKPNSIKENDQIILFDGVCNLCSGFMQFVYKRDAKAVFKLVWLQEKAGEEILQYLDLPTANLKTIILIEHGEPFYKSTAFLKIVRHLRFPWPMLSVGVIIPNFIRNRIYDWVANHRYRWFGKKEQCLLPSGALAKRFL
jgi:predicted DCC family thiol-disulfide oxidoreductase YuxK